MHQLYYEARNLPHSPTPTLASDISRHLQNRQYLGRALVICDSPNAMLSAIRKQWFKATRYLLRQRASTLNAEEILRLTHALMHMQNLVFLGAKDPAEHPEGSVFFATPDQLTNPPEGCYTVYLADTLSQTTLAALCDKLPDKSLIVSYVPVDTLVALGLQPKHALDRYLQKEWRAITEFLARHDLSPDRLVVGNVLQFDEMDASLDILLSTGPDFLRQAAAFQHAINLCQPLQNITNEQLKKFEAVTRLAHRVQALTPGSFNTFLSVTFGDISKDAFFLRDIGSQLYMDLEMQAISSEMS